MFCPKCGKELPDGAQFCVYCGKAVSFELQQTQKQIVTPDLSDGNTSQDSYVIEENAPQQKSVLQQKKKSIAPKIITGLAALLLIILIGGYVWLTTNFPRAELDDFLASSVTSTLPLGNTFGRNDFSLTPIEVSYASSEVGYDDYGEPYAAIMLDITCLSGKWKPNFDDIAFWLNGDYALSHTYTDAEIKRGETARYTFTHPLFTSSTKDVSMQLTIECLTGATIDLYFPVNGVSEFFNQGNPSDNSAYPPILPPIDPNDPNAAIYSRYYGLYINKEGYVLEVGKGSDMYGSNYARIYQTLSDARNYAEPILELSGGMELYGSYGMGITFRDGQAEIVLSREDDLNENNLTFDLGCSDDYYGGVNVSMYSQSIYYMIERGIDIMT